MMRMMLDISMYTIFYLLSVQSWFAVITYTHTYIQTDRQTCRATYGSPTNHFIRFVCFTMIRFDVFVLSIEVVVVVVVVALEQKKAAAADNDDDDYDEATAG